ncbi:MAG: BspA family leucine-rich repeat surface protein [Proteobacteria bacterium]|nr:BspA family leucine-rich repeat surface protein [Pseudomonadota bacterium]
MKRIFFVVTGLIGFMAGCNLDNLRNDGEKCPDWAYIHRDNARACGAGEIAYCDEDIQAARNIGRCPGVAEMCTYNNARERICVGACPDGQRLCNDKCIGEKAYSLAKIELIDGMSYCDPCPSECPETCHPETHECPPDVIINNIECPDVCLNGCDDNGACICPTDCLNGCDHRTGMCLCPVGCVNGCTDKGACKCDISCRSCDATGETCCMDSCQNGCNSNGSCLCPEGCINGCDVSGSRCCDASCKHGCDLDGQCTCPSRCVNGCHADGTCIPDEGCVIGVAENGRCKCPEECRNGCDRTGAACACPLSCAGGCDRTGASCTCESECVDGSSCDSATGMCTCIDKCKFGCDETGTCDEACENIECIGENEKCRKGECVDLCKTVACNSGQYCKMGRCVPEDVNLNHMHDMYETAPRQGESCRKHADCDLEAGNGDGFCDSFVGYKCSTKCTSDAQCVQDGVYHYICRADGRCAPDSFVTVWQIPDDSKGLKIPFTPGMCGIVTVEWGDGNENTYSDCSNMSHEYEKSGIYEVRIKGSYEYLSLPLPEDLNNTMIEDDRDKLIEVKAFGPVVLDEAAFAACVNLKKVSVIDIPNSAMMTRLKRVFLADLNFDSPIGNWDVSGVTSMEAAFMYAVKFNHPIGAWDTSSVINMNSMFLSALSFDQPLDSWDTSKVINMAGMFQAAVSFNQPLEHWDTSNVQNMAYMFSEASKFNQPLNSWNTSKVRNMAYMFKGEMRSDKNGTATITIDPADPNVSSRFRPDSLNGWDTSNVENMAGMFQAAVQFNGAIDQWDTHKVKNMAFMFQGAAKFNGEIGQWDTQNVEAMNNMFEVAHSFDANIGNWNTSKVKNMNSMFVNTKAFDQDLSAWVVQRETSVSDIFRGSNISEVNYCKIQKSSTWQNKTDLGLNMTCK